MPKILVTLLFSFTFSICSSQINYNIFANKYPIPKRETRAVWLTTLSNLDWPKTYATSTNNIIKQKQELINILDLYYKANINTVILQTRVRATTIYPSAIEPWDRAITGVAGKAPIYSYDPLKFAIEECHKRGMEIYAWIVAIPIGKKGTIGYKNIKRKGLKIKDFATGSYLDPNDTRIRNYLANICGEIVSKYNVDGINLDYIRYPDEWTKPTWNKGDTPNNRRHNITMIVKAICNRVKAIKPWIKLSCSPIGKYSDLSRYSSKNYNAYNRVFQEAQEWVKNGIMDQLFPMQYFRDNNYYPFCADWVENSNGKDIVSGLATYFLDKRNGNWSIKDIANEMNVSRWLGMGHAHFRSSFLTNNYQGVYDFEKIFNATPALTKCTVSKTKNLKPQTPKLISNKSTITNLENEATTSLSWTGVTPYYNIYMSKNYPVDINDPRNLLFARLNRTSFSHNIKRAYNYAITALDQYGNESYPIQCNFIGNKIKSKLIENDGKWIYLPKWINDIDIKFIEICSLENITLKRIYIKGYPKKLNIYFLPNGMYSLYSISKKNKSKHRIGFFTIKR